MMIKHFQFRIYFKFHEYKKFAQTKAIILYTAIDIF